MTVPAPGPLLARRAALRDAQLDAIASASRRHGAAALHVFGSVGRGTADALSDLDVRLTVPDEMMGSVVRDRAALFASVGEVLLTHEMAPNRPPGGVYALVLYATDVGPLQVDWSLAPQASSRVEPTARSIFADIAVPVGTQSIDAAATHAENQSERIDWLACMLFVALKGIVRGRADGFSDFLGKAYRDVCSSYGIEGCSVSDPRSLDDVGAMLHQLERHADPSQRRALRAIDAFRRELTAYAS